MANLRFPAGRRPAAQAAAIVVALVAAACTGSGAGDTAVATVDGGDRGVALLGDVVVAASAGGSVTIKHGSKPTPSDTGSPVTHAFVGGAPDELPPLFVGGRQGLVPNPAVWGQCRGGSVEDATTSCPVPPAEGPQRWDGTAYWSTGAMLPGEEREVPLAEELPAGDVALVCALHPQLRVVVRSDAKPQPPAPAAQRVQAAIEGADESAAPDGTVVAAGQLVGDAYVARFLPETVVVPVGQTVTWRASSRAPVDVVFNTAELDLTHTNAEDGVPSDDAPAWNGRGALRSGFLSSERSAGAAGSAWSVTFIKPGRYPYGSRFGSELRGTVEVRRP